MNRVLTIVGSSARAAARSAADAGFLVRAGDLFGDADLRRIGQATRVSQYPAGLAAVVGGSQPGAWMYTGALENHASLVDAMVRQRPLWGNPGAILRHVRSPRLVAEALGRSGLACPPVAVDPRAVPRDGSWLCKPRRSAGGRGIRFWTHQSPPTDRRHACYFQQFVEGAACSAVYVAARGRAVLLGITRQLIGQAWAAAGPFRYCGSVGPIRLSAAAAENFAAIGATLAKDFHLVGLFGVDAVVNTSGVWPLEVNPRYTASAEILERASGVSTIALHAAACEQDRLPGGLQPASGPMCGKTILFASSRLEISTAWTETALEARSQGRPSMADIPQAGSVIEAGWPLVTIFADAVDEKTVLKTLRQKAAEVAASVPGHNG